MNLFNNIKSNYVKLDSNYIFLHLTEGDILYKASSNFDNNIFTDLLEMNATATALLYLNENCSLLADNDITMETLKKTNNTVESYYNECNKLLKESTEVVEEIGKPLCNINGYNIYEGQGYILRGNGKLKLKESSNIEALANKILDLMYDFDTYSFNDDYDNKEEAYNHILNQLNSKDSIDSIIDFLVNIIKDEDESYANNAFDIILELKKIKGNSLTESVEDDKEFRYALLDRLRSDCDYFLNYGNRQEKFLWAKDVKDQIAKMKELYNSFSDDEKPEWLSLEDIDRYEKEMTTDNIKEEAEGVPSTEVTGTQTTDIADKADQEIPTNLSNNKENKKHYELLLSKSDELEEQITLKGFLRNKDGEYQRGNHILVKENNQYKVIRKNK